MSQLNLTKIRKYAHRMDDEREKEQESISKVTDREVREIYEKDPTENIKGGLFDSLSKDVDIDTFVSFTGFGLTEFDRLHDIVHDYIDHQGRGRHPKFGTKDILVLLLFYLRRYPRYETIRSIFRIPESSFKGILKTYIPKLLEVLEKKFITDIAETCSIEEDDYFKDCGYVVDATVQPIEIPKSSYEAKKPYFSGKHGVYCFKSQVIVTFQGIAVHIITGIEGGKHDKTVFDDSIQDFTTKVLSHHEDEPTKILGDKGYQDQTCDILVTPFKGELLDLEDTELEHNENLGKKRVIVENYFGRLKSRYGITKDTYRSDYSMYPSFFLICCALINFEIVFCGHPLRNSDSVYYVKLVTKMMKDAQLRKALNSRKHKKYKKKRKADFLEKYDLLPESSDDSSNSSNTDSSKSYNNVNSDSD